MSESTSPPKGPRGPQGGRGGDGSPGARDPRGEADATPGAAKPGGTKAYRAKSAAGQPGEGKSVYRAAPRAGDRPGGAPPRRAEGDAGKPVVARPAPPPLLPGAQPRAIAARVLDAVLHRGRSLKAELAAALPTLPDPRDRALVEAMCFAVLRQPLRYEAALEAWMPRALSRRDGELRALLYAGLAQLDPLQLPAHAALAATVEATRALGRKHQAGLVNALLRRAQRDGLPATDPRHSHWPSWLRGLLRKQWPDHFDAILANSAIAPPMWLRVNAARVGREDYRAQLAQAGIPSIAPAAPVEALRLQEAVPVSTLPGFAEGLVSIQDLSAQLVADALSPAPGARVLDACAAPGGKSAHLLERDGALRLTALDIDAQRLQRVRGGLIRQGFADRVELLAADAAELDAWWDGRPFDAVLLDAPCSATGIVRRQPDVVLHRRVSDIPALTVLQARLLDALWHTVAPGGVLVYATCSILQEENEAQVRAFLARTPDARSEALDARYGHDREVGRQRLPGEDDGDGFFYARLRRSPPDSAARPG
ncbi:16S rRNA (cytosine(967)-C(5))-methyltransferase RsmB [Lysobacter capsici]|uniref:16S rRNA (cytosine(967)-C(5))-methyltransferase RsmB n=1 Tax=Lysobacter capsici TaxID=435897 RepID=UPI0009E2CEFE|nr:16S rRNA (cytosine(967)-C(5))-methyltransferase RsmB [Lysobacter capsici]